MSADSETVADVLNDADLWASVEPLYWVARGDKDPDELDYKDWVRPMKLTGGRVCLRLERDGGDRPGFLTVDGAGFLRWMVDDGRPSSLPHPDELRQHLDDPELTITPVLREDTPFGGEAHG